MPQKMAVAVSALMAAGAICLSAAPSGVIGMISAGSGQSGVSIDGARVSGNATVFDGSVISSSSYSRMELNSGARVDLATGSEARVFSNHIALESGMSEVQSASGFSIDARNFRIQPAEAKSIARVRLDADQKVLVTAVSAPVNVWNRYGLLVARVTPAAPMAFLPQAASTASNYSGCVLNKSKTPLLVDDKTGDQVTLRSTSKNVDLRKFIGKHASVTGTVNSSKVFEVSSISAASGGDCSAVAARVGATMSAAGIAAGGAAAAGAAGAGAAAGAAGAAAGAAAGISGAAIGGIVAAGAVTAAVTGAVIATKSP